MEYLKDMLIIIAPKVILSAIGSSIFPQSVIILNFLAILPSKKSVIPEITIVTITGQ